MIFGNFQRLNSSEGYSVVQSVLLLVSGSHQSRLFDFAHFIFDVGRKSHFETGTFRDRYREVPLLEHVAERVWSSLETVRKWFENIEILVEVR